MQREMRTLSCLLSLLVDEISVPDVALFYSLCLCKNLLDEITVVLSH